MKQTICFHALQTLPIEQQRNMVKRLQNQNAQCDGKTSDNNLILTIENIRSNRQEQIDSLDQM